MTDAIEKAAAAIADAIRAARNAAPVNPGLDADDLGRIAAQAAFAAFAEASGEAGPAPASPLPWGRDDGVNDHLVTCGRDEDGAFRYVLLYGLADCDDSLAVMHRVNNWDALQATLTARTAEVEALRAELAEAKRERDAALSRAEKAEAAVPPWLTPKVREAVEVVRDLTNEDRAMLLAHVLFDDNAGSCVVASLLGALSPDHEEARDG